MEAVRYGDHERLAVLIAQGGSDVNLNAKDRVRMPAHRFCRALGCPGAATTWVPSNGGRSC